MRKYAYEVVLKRILQQIEDGQIEAGSRLPAERDMAVEYGVSRGSLREALRILEQSGYVQSIPGGGRILVRGQSSEAVIQQYANNLSNTSLQEFFEIRASLDDAAISLACERATEEDIAAVRAAIEKCDHNDLMPEDRVSKSNMVNMAIVRAAHNAYLEEVYRISCEFVPLVRLKTLSTAKDRAMSQKEHRQILEALEKRDVDMARLATKVHHAHIIARMKAADNQESGWPEKNADDE